MPATFIHLRVHTAYSLSEGAIRIRDLPGLCRRHHMPAVAITDTNNLFGALEFSTTMAAAGIQPIIGCQLALADEDGGDGAGGAPAAGPDADPIVVLVQTAEGYRNLLALLAAAHLGTGRAESAGGAAGSPHVRLDDLARHNKGLITLTGGPAGPVGRRLAQGHGDAAAAVLDRLKGIFPDRLYVEVQRHGLDEESDAARIEPLLLELADRGRLPLVATNEAFFPTPDMFEAHDALICIAEGTLMANDQRRRLTPEHAFKSAEAMAERFADLPDAIENTVLIARRCGFFVEPVKPMLPPFATGTGLDAEATLHRQAHDGLTRRLADRSTGALAKGEAAADAAGIGADAGEAGRAAVERRYRERLDYELRVICEMGFAGYFLIVAEFIQWARRHGIPVGPGRGSGAGSVAAWSLTITDLDPLRFGLLFERFLNPERVSMPDFDIDFCQDRRDEVIHHVQEKYGRDRVAQIITFGKLQARAVLRDVGRVLGMAYGHVDRICKLVPNNPANPVTLPQAIEGEPQLQTMIREDEGVARLVDIAQKLEGLYRHASTHAAGVVIGDRPLQELIPLYRDPRSDLPVTGFNMKWVESAGLVKFDFLGLKTLTVLAKAVDLVTAATGTRLDLSNLPLDDAKTFRLLGEGSTVGVFQLESAGMRDALRKLKPDKFEDIIAVVALYRPGPMDNIPSYIRRKHGEEEPDYLYPSLRPILEETYGIIIYQEQVMQIAQELAGYSLGAADILRRAMGKKNKEEMERQRAVFAEGAAGRGAPPARAAFIFDLVAKFAGYGFNKSHAAAYALVAYQTAYLKANHPVAFMAASMALEVGHPEKISTFRQELTRLDVTLLPPDVNASAANFTVADPGSGDGRGGAIRYGLAAVKNVGQAAMESLVAERQRSGPFADLEDFCRRMEPRQVNKRQIENLAKAGAFDSLEPNRRRVFEGAEAIVRHAAQVARERESGQMGLFAAAPTGSESWLRLPDVPDWPMVQRIREEFLAIGFYLSQHPIMVHEKALRRLGVTPIAEAGRRVGNGALLLAGTVTGKKERTSGRGSRYAFVDMSDASGVFEVTVFAELLASCRELLEVGNALLVRAAARADGDLTRLTAQSIEPLEAAAARTSAGAVVHVHGREGVSAIRERLPERSAGGSAVTVVCWVPAVGEVEIDLPGRYAAGPETLAGLRDLPGVSAVEEI
ncbi:MAG: DNA polymerase III subunit alpha [Rhodospirillales bacterium]|nr:MAG: DNA polymerase III subunit alpha [Rhodospirillales bacterium]